MNTNKPPYQKPSYQKTQPFQPRYIDPDKEQNTLLIDNLFMLFSEGNYMKIKNYILANNLNENVADNNNNTIIHKIIENNT
jgi:hypothetical protein